MKYQAQINRRCACKKVKAGAEILGLLIFGEGPNIPKKLNFHSHERYYSSSFHVSTGCQEGRLVVLPVWWTDLLPFRATTAWLFFVKEI